MLNKRIQIIRRIVSLPLKESLELIKDVFVWRSVKYKYKKVCSGYPKVIKRLKQKDKIDVAFFLVESAMWKYDSIFNLMIKSSKFNPVVVICPHAGLENPEQGIIIDKAYHFITNKKIPCFVAINRITGELSREMMEFSPDIIFYTFPYESTQNYRFSMRSFPNSLSCYVPYSSMICSSNFQFDKPLQNFAWSFFVENEQTLDLIKKKSPTRGRNSVVTGLPAFDLFFDTNYKPKNVWINDDTIKIIWAPHYTIHNNTSLVSFSSFLEYAEPMVGIALKYQSRIQIAFKPHPFLRLTLNKEWGKERTDEYYAKWESMPNTFLQTDDYVDLFLTSDAMIFDSVSFINEYLYTLKPSLFTYRPDILDQLNPIGQRALDCHSKATNIKDVEDFIIDRISNKGDEMLNLKQQYYNVYLKNKNECCAAENIIAYITNKL